MWLRRLLGADATSLLEGPARPAPATETASQLILPGTDAWRAFVNAPFTPPVATPPSAFKMLDLLAASAQSARGMGGLDGLTACARILAEIADIKQREPHRRVVVSFDLDNTLFETRQRTLEVLKAYDAWSERQGPRRFDGLILDAVGLNARHTLDLLELAEGKKIDGHERQAIHDFWLGGFWEGAHFLRDLVIEPVFALAWAAKAVGAEVTYVTGRVNKAATLAQLEHAGLPDAIAGNLFCKPTVETDTQQFKADVFNQWLDRGDHVGWFLTEGCRDIEEILKRVPRLPCIRLPFPYEVPGEAIAHVPVLPHAWSQQRRPIGIAAP
ncbi:MAG: hypothetical protein IT384_34180 [Deltaproteobacteria bacterium]|nr:hypothetical protein [Deltaproteobacteria bacterium]